jgi:hypothetical protein
MELSYIGFSIDGDDNDEQEAFSEMLEKEHPFYICEGGNGSWFATIKSGTGSDYLKQATNYFPGNYFLRNVGRSRPFGGGEGIPFAFAINDNSFTFSSK